MLGFDHHKVNYTLGARGLGATELSDESAKVSRRKVARKKSLTLNTGEQKDLSHQG